MTTSDQTEPSTEIELRTEMDEMRAELEQLRHTQAVARPPVGPLDEWVHVIRDYNLLGQSLARTNFVPDSFQGKPDQITAAMMYGREIGLPPVTTLQNMHVIKGKVGMYAEQLRAMVLAAGHEYEVEEMTSDRCVMQARRKGSERWHRFEYTMDQAKRSGDAAKNDMYQKRPVEMLFARCSGVMAHALFPDVIRGMGALEELETSDTEAPPAAPAVEAAKANTVQRAPRARKQPERAPAVVDVELPDSPALPPLPGEEVAPAAVSDPPSRRTEAEIAGGGVQSGGSAAVTPGEGMASATDSQSPAADTEPDAYAPGAVSTFEPRQCPNISNGEQCRYAAGHIGQHTYGGGLQDPVHNRHCPDYDNLHESHAWTEGKDTFACSGVQRGPEQNEPDTSGPLPVRSRPITPATTRLLQATFKRLGYTDEPDDRENRLKVAAALAGVNVVNSFRAGQDDSLTNEQAQAILTALADCQNRDDVLELLVRRAQDAAAEETQA